MSQPVSSVIERIVLPPGPMMSPDLVDRNVDDVQARSVLREIGPGGVDDGFHLLEDVEAAGLGLSQGLSHDLAGHTLDLDVHLQGGDSVPGTGDLEVHVAEVILGSGDVAQYGEVVITLDQTPWRHRRPVPPSEHQRRRAPGRHHRR